MAKILVVDDEPNVADLLVVILEHAGFEAEACYTGQEAVARSAAWRPDLLLMDVVLRDGDGVEFAAAICAALPEIQVAIFSGQADLRPVAQRMTRMACAGTRLIGKPVHPDDLLAGIREMLPA